MKFFLFKQYFGNSIGCKLILSYSSQVYWKEIKRVLLQITWEVCVAVGNGKQISGLKLLVLCSKPFSLCKKEGCQKGSSAYRQSRLFDVFKKNKQKTPPKPKKPHQFQKTRIYLCKDYLRYSSPIVSLLVYLLASSNIYWRFYPKMSVVLVSRFKIDQPWIYLAC